MPRMTIIDFENQLAGEALADVGPLFFATLRRLAQHQGVEQSTLCINKRESSGWLEFLLMIEYLDGSKLTVGCLQREPGAVFEFHT